MALKVVIGSMKDSMHRTLCEAFWLLQLRHAPNFVQLLDLELSEKEDYRVVFCLERMPVNLLQVGLLPSLGPCPKVYGPLGG